MSTLEAAHAYAHNGWRVIPLRHVIDRACSCRSGLACPSSGKHPIHDDWVRLASNAGADIEAWWEDHPHANVGIATGPESRLWVLDVDPAKGGIESLLALIEDRGPLPPTRIIKTGSGGLHYYFAWPEFTVYNSSDWLGPGLDVRGKGGQVVAPPSASAKGSYAIVADREPGRACDWLLEAVREHSRQRERGTDKPVVPAEPVDAAWLPPDVAELASTLVPVDQGRYRHFHALVAACRRAGYTQGQTVTIARPWCEAVNKFANRVAAEVARSWGKLEGEDERAEAWLPGSTQPGIAQPEQNPGPTQPDENAPEDDQPPTWQPLDLGPILDGDQTRENPTLLTRTDGHSLLYPGRTHSLHGESESGKSLIAQAETARILTDPDAGRTLYIDFESDAAAVIGRLLDLGAHPDQIRARLDYIRPDVDPRRFPAERDSYLALLTHAYTLAVIDGVTDALGVFGASSKDNDEVAAFMRILARPLAARTGAAVVLIDHVTKDADTRGRFAVGAQSKMATLDGAAYVVEVLEPLGRGLRGVIGLRVAKDRPGAVRPQCGIYRKTDRTQEAARVVIDSTNGHIKATVEPPRTSVTDDGDKGQPFRPTAFMERISQLLEGSEQPLSGRTISEAISGDDKRVRQALALLVAERYVVQEAGPRNAQLHRSTRPYRQDQDPGSDVYTGWVS